MQLGFEKFFGAKCDYLARRLYNLFSGPKKTPLDKILWLNKCWEILHGKPAYLPELSWMLYDFHHDDMLTSNELSDLVACLPEYSPMYNEAMRLGEIII